MACHVIICAGIESATFSARHHARLNNHRRFAHSRNRFKHFQPFKIGQTKIKKDDSGLVVGNSIKPS
jgi:hypothetical protein